MIRQILWSLYIGTLICAVLRVQAQAQAPKKLRLQVQTDHESGSRVRVDGKDFYLTGGAQGNVIKWDKRTGKVLWVAKVQKEGVREILLLKDGTFIVKRRMRQWDVQTGKLIKDYEVIGDQVEFNRKKDILCVYTKARFRAGTISLIDLKKRKKIQFETVAPELSLKENGVIVRISRDQKHIFYRSLKSGFSVWEKETGKRLTSNFNIPKLSREHIYLAKEKLLYTINQVKKQVNGRPRYVNVMRKWNAKKMIQEYPCGRGYVKLFNFESLTYFLMMARNQVEFRDKKTNQVIKRLELPRVSYAYITPNRKQLIFSKSRGKGGWVYDLGQGKITQTYTINKKDKASKQLLTINRLEASIATYDQYQQATKRKSGKKRVRRKPKVKKALTQVVNWDAKRKALYFKNEDQVVKWYMKYNRWISLPRRDNFITRRFKNLPEKQRQGLRPPKVMILPGKKRQLVVEEVKLDARRKYKQVSLWNIASQEKIHTYEGFKSRVAVLKVIQNQALLISTQREVLYYPTLKSAQPKYRFLAKGSKAYMVLPGDNEVLVYDFEVYRTNDYTIRHYSLKTGELIRKYAIDSRQRLYSIKLIPLTSHFIAVYQKGVTRKWDYRTGEDVTPANFKFIGRKVEVLPDNKTLMNTRNLCFWNIKTGEKIYDLRSKDFTTRGIASAILPDKEHVIVTDGTQMFGTGVATTLLAKFNYKTGKMVFNLRERYTNGRPAKLIPLPDGKTFLTVQNNGLIIHRSLEDGKVLKSYKSRLGAPKGYQLNRDSTQLITTHQLGAVTLWDLTKRKEIVSALVRGVNDYLVISPKGYYATTKATVNNIHYVQNNKVFLFDQLDLIFNRPDKILQAVGLASQRTLNRYRRAYKKRLKGFGLKEELIKKLMESDFDEQYDYPEIFRKGKGANQKTIESIKPNYKIKVAIRDRKVKLDRYNVYVNGVALYGKNGQSLRGKNVKSLDKKINIPLSQGINNVEITALNSQGVSALKEKFQVIFKPKKPLPKPSLHIVTIGVSQYQNKKYNLNFARKDAQDMLAAFTQNVSGLFKEVKTYPLYDQGVSTAKLDQIKKKLLKTQVDDYVLVFYAGHGLLDANQDYFLGTYAVDFDNPQKGGLPYQRLENLIDGIPARQKLLLVDACHSGEVDKDGYEEVAVTTDKKKVTFRGFTKGSKNSRKKSKTNKRSIGLKNSYQLMKELFTDLRKGTGATILSSAGGGEFALESEEWKNGVFTYSILNGLKNKKADQNKDGKIMLNELQNYLYQQVEKLTNGKQHPTSRIKNLNNNFRIW